MQQRNDSFLNVEWLIAYVAILRVSFGARFGCFFFVRHKRMRCAHMCWLVKFYSLSMRHLLFIYWYNHKFLPRINDKKKILIGISNNNMKINLKRISLLMKPSLFISFPHESLFNLLLFYTIALLFSFSFSIWKEKKLQLETHIKTALYVTIELTRQSPALRQRAGVMKNDHVLQHK